MEEANQGPWYFKQNEDGIFVKLNEERVKNKKENLMEQVLDVSPARGRDKDLVVITFKDMLSPSGKFDMKFALDNFEFHKNDFTESLLDNQSGKEFSNKCRELIRSACISTPSTSGTAAVVAVDEDESAVNLTDTTMHKTPLKRGKKGSKRKTSTPVPEGADLPSPEKIAKPNTLDEKIQAHFLGHYNLKLSTLRECPLKWLDRRLDERRVNSIAREIEANPSMICNGQPWLAIADVAREDLEADKNLIRGAKLELIGGLHRHAAVKKVVATNEKEKKSLDKVWVNVYSSKLSDEEIRRLASKHNTENQGSVQTKWFERVTACRHWLYHMAGKNYDEDETPASTSNWKRACQSMYMATNKDVNALEPTVQAALLPKTTWDLLVEVSKMFDAGTLKGAKIEKPSRRKSNPQLTQNQVGMPLQGLEQASKEDLLRKVVQRKLSLKEMRQAADNIKKKKIVVSAFLKFTGEEDWESLQKRFPRHATEEKLAQFKGVPLKKNKDSPVLEAFFRRALAWEKEGGEENEDVMHAISLSEERDGVYFYQSGQEIGVMLNGHSKNLPLQQIRSIVPGMKGFDLVMIYLDKNTQETEFKKFLTAVHARNVDEMQRYNVAVIYNEDATEFQVGKVMEGKLHSVQRAFWFDTRDKKPQGHLLQNSLTPLLIGHWVAEGQVTERSCNFLDANASNVFPCKGGDEGKIPLELAATIIKKFSFEGQWVLDLTCSNAGGIRAGLPAKRNVVCLEENDTQLRKSAAMITTAAAVQEQGKEDHEIEEEEDGEVPTEDEKD